MFFLILTLPTNGTVETRRKRLMKHIGLATVRLVEVRMSKSLCVILADLELSVRDGFQLATTVFLGQRLQFYQ